MSDIEVFADEAVVEDAPRRLDRWMFVAALVLSLATLATAWATFESSRWGGLDKSSNSAATAARIASNDQSALANRQMLTDIFVFSDWFAAELRGDTELSAEIKSRFRGEFVPFFERWYGTATDIRSTVGTPFGSETYKLQAQLEAERLLEDAQAASDRAGEAASISEQFILTAVLYASVLFLAGISSKLPSKAVQHFMIGLSGVAFVVATGFMVALPTYPG